MSPQCRGNDRVLTPGIFSIAKGDGGGRGGGKEQSFDQQLGVGLIAELKSHNPYPCSEVEEQWLQMTGAFLILLTHTHTHFWEGWGITGLKCRAI